MRWTRLLIAMLVFASLAMLMRPADAQTLDHLHAKVRQYVETAIAGGELPGAVVGFWHDGQWMLREAYGQRSVDPDESMTLDTLFDMASITKPMATATSAMLLAQAGKLDLNAPVQSILSDFTGQGRDEVRIWHLMTHTAGLIPDNALDDYQHGPDHAWQKLMKSEVKSPPGETFAYSDVGFLMLGKVVQQASGQPLDAYAQEAIFTPLSMRDTGYLPGIELRGRIAPTELREGRMLRGEVHDPRAALLGGVAGHAGLFSTLDDIALYARMMLDNGRLPSGEPLMQPETVWTMTRPFPIEVRSNFGIVSRTRGWDHHSPYSYNGGKRLSPSAFGHGGFTGTVLWIDPDQNSFFVFLSNRLHPDGKGNVNQLAGKIATLVVETIQPTTHARSTVIPPLNATSVPAATANSTSTETSTATESSPATLNTTSNALHHELPDTQPNAVPASGMVETGLDVLAARGFRDLAGKRVGLVTNQTGIDRHGRSTLSLLANSPNVQLVALFSPEHGIEGNLDVNKIGDSRDAGLNVPIYSLYGETRRPKPEHLEQIDVLVYDIQDIGTRFYTYISTMKNCLQACAAQRKEFMVLDRPNPIGSRVAGPMRDMDRETFVACHPLPVQHGMTVGELALLFNKEENLVAHLTVIPIRNWMHRQCFDATGLWWVNPSPNMRTLEAAMLYPGIGLLEMTNISVGRGTDRPFQWIGAPWIDGQKLAQWLNDQNLPGIRAIPRKMTPESSKHAAVECSGVQFVINDASTLDALQLGLTLAQGLNELYGATWESSKIDTLLVNKEITAAIQAGASYDQLKEQMAGELAAFLRRRAGVLLYD